MKRPFSDWKTEIAIAWRVQEYLQQLDRDGIWEYHLPRVAAGEDELVRAEGTLQLHLDQKFRTFLTFANGWPDFFQSVDLFGTVELISSPLMRRANDALKEYVDVLWDEYDLTLDDVLPIAKSKHDLDIFVIVRPSRPNSGQVIWLAGSHFESFPDFNEFFLSMVDYNRLRLERLRSQILSEEQT